MPFFRFTSDFVYWHNLDPDVHEKIKSVFLPIIRKKEKEHAENNPFEIGSATTSFFYNPAISKQENEFLCNEELLESVIWTPLDSMIKKHNSNPEFSNININNSFMESSWYTSYKKDDYFDIHHHDNNVPIIRNGTMFHSTFSIIYILNDQSNQNTTTFISYDKLLTRGLPQVIYDTKKNADIKEGTVLIFPSRLLHCVGRQIHSNRVTIAFNIFSSYD